MHSYSGRSLRLYVLPFLIFFIFRYFSASVDFIPQSKRTTTMLSSAARLARPALRLASSVPKTAAVRAMSAMSEGENVVVPLVTDSLEWTLSSPPPLHQFEEPPLIVEVEHLDLKPGAEVETVLEAQGETITDIVGKEQWVDNDPALYEGLIPQNKEWTEFIDEKTGDYVYMDEYGNRVEKPTA